MLSKKVHGLEKHMINLRKVRELEKVQDECEVGNCVKLKDANNKNHACHISKA